MLKTKDDNKELTPLDDVKIEDLSIDDELILEQDLDESLNYNLEIESEEDEEQMEQTNENLNIMFNFQTNKHKREGKHALKRDIIFNGKLNKEIKDDYDIDENQPNIVYKVETGSSFEFESRNNEDYVNQRQLSKDVLEVLTEHTDIDFTTNRRKPNRQTFNEYYTLLLSNLKLKYTHSEIFVELAYYFTDNIFNMFKLLDKRYATIIIKELKSKGYLKDLDNINFI